MEERGSEAPAELKPSLALVWQEPHLPGLVHTAACLPS
jgi:hypothetical protein